MGLAGCRVQGAGCRVLGTMLLPQPLPATPTWLLRCSPQGPAALKPPWGRDTQLYVFINLRVNTLKPPGNDSLL